jgi:hypothetical protein
MAPKEDKIEPEQSEEEEQKANNNKKPAQSDEEEVKNCLRICFKDISTRQYQGHG